MTKLIISSDLGTNSSGNIVASKELDAMRQLETQQGCCHNNVIQICHNDISPIMHGLPDSPFLQDYLTLECLSKIDLSKIDLCHIYSTPYTQTIRYLKAKGIKTSITCAAHDRFETIREFENLGIEYPFKHISDDRLWEIFSGDILEADIVITPSKASAEFLKKEGSKRIEVIPHGIDIPDRNKIKPISEEFKVGYLGASGPDKGLKYLIQAWSQLNYSDSILVIAGRGTEQLGQFINKYATGGKFHLAGYINNVADFYNDISVYIQPSVVEGWGMEVGEAMSYGRSVICSDGAGASDVITDGFDGFVVPKRNPKAIAEKIDWFKNHPDKMNKMGENARTTSFKYDWNIIKDKYVNVWRSMV